MGGKDKWEERKGGDENSGVKEGRKEGREERKYWKEGRKEGRKKGLEGWEGLVGRKKRRVRKEIVMGRKEERKDEKKGNMGRKEGRMGRVERTLQNKYTGALSSQA